ncbi:hypothetical protein [Candidatus Poriferisodalis sp.]|uniref:hypothetical protein n=1 Tax=Candidatus Poriferisodalis sp. TaxID=3101277 RepID=UPI003B5AA30C
MPTSQQARLDVAASGGFVVGGVAAVPATKVAGRDMIRLAGTDRWHTARLVGAQARRSAGITRETNAADASADAELDTTDCTDNVPILVASDAAAESDLYSAVTLAGAIGTDCIVRAGARSESISADQMARLDASAGGGFIVGGMSAVPEAKVAGRDMTRLAGTDRWHTACLVGDQARLTAQPAGTDSSPCSPRDRNDDPPADESGASFKAVAASSQHTCALRTDNTITCWGYNSHGQSDPPDGSYTAVTAGSGHTCGLRTDSTIHCWGNNRSPGGGPFGGNWLLNQAIAPDGNYTSVTARGDQTCALRTSGAVVCWGQLHTRTADPVVQ